MKWMQSASSRWLAAIASFAAVLVIVSVLISILAGNGNSDLLPADTPEGTVQRYLQALADDDVAAAYGYMSADLKDECSLELFLQTSFWREQNFGAALSRTVNIDGRSIVNVEITEQGNNLPFGQGQYTFTTSFTMALENGEWCIAEPPWPVSWCPPERELQAPTRPGVAIPAEGAGAMALPPVRRGEGERLHWNT